MIKKTLQCVSVLTFIGSAISLLTVIVSSMTLETQDMYSPQAIAVIIYALITWFLFVTAIKMWKTEELDKVGWTFGLALLLSVFLFVSGCVGFYEGIKLSSEIQAPAQKIKLPVYKADYFTETEQAREYSCSAICSEFPEAARYFVYVSGRDDGNVCECYSSDDILLRMVPMD